MGKNKVMRLLCRLFLYSFMSFAAAITVNADDLATSQAQKQRIEAELKTLQKKVSENAKETSKQRKKLESVESLLSRLYRNIATLELEVAEQKRLIQELSERKESLQKKLAEKSDDIKSILRLAYKQNNQPLIKLLLSGARPEDLTRFLYYFSILTSNQNELVNQWLSEQGLLSETITRNQEETQRLSLKQDSLQKERKALEVEKDKRKQILTALKDENKSVSATIASKTEERLRLEELIKQMQAELERMALEFPEVTAISDSKGQLNWPVSGRLQNQYGRRIEGSALRWQGLLIAAPEGTPVRAVHGGRVVFADFFKSNGLLVIIDHGQGIWSLYGRNRSLLTEVGAWVDAGDVIAEVGQSGGYSESGLYFEVRNNGKPLNPAAWLSKR